MMKFEFLRVKATACIAALLLTFSVASAEPAAGKGGYLFAHMTEQNYGSLFYCVSRDGISWEQLNDGKEIIDGYFGHPDICMAPDIFGNAPKRWYMIGVVRDSPKEALVLYHTTDFLVWEKQELDGNLFVVDHLGVYNEIPFVGAPKLFYDEDSQQFLITWHAGEFYRKMQLSDNPAVRHVYWCENWETMKTCYMLTKDFKNFTRPQRFFADPQYGDLAPIYFTGLDATIATIDVIIRKIDGKYYAIMKDERGEEKAPVTHKSIRIASSDHLLGPYTNPGPPVTPNYREAPCLVKTLDGKYRLYFEDYSFHVYEMLESTAIEGAPWKKIAIFPPKEARHGCILPITEEQYQALKKKF